MDYTYEVQDAAIDVRELSKTYKRGRTAFAAVRPMTLAIPAGQVFGLLGPNGAGNHHHQDGRGARHPDVRNGSPLRARRGTAAR